ncbi:MAG: GNAT family N-acetyltransferase [Candidatus Acidiferrales bacterium]
MKLSIREFDAADFETIYKIDQVCYSPDIAYSRVELQWYLELRGADCLIAEISGSASTRRKQIAGFIITARQRLHGHIVTIDVLEAYRRAGVGASLLRSAETRLRRRGAREVWLETATDNEAAIAFWEKHGYRTRGRLANYYPKGLDALAMSKVLAGSASAKS